MYYNFYAELKKHNWTQYELANFLEISNVSMCLKLKGKQEFTMKQIKKCLKKFDTTFEYLFETKED